MAGGPFPLFEGRLRRGSGRRGRGAGVTGGPRPDIFSREDGPEGPLPPTRIASGRPIMTSPDPVSRILSERRLRLQTETGRPLRVPRGDEAEPLTPERRRYLLEEATELYWNDLEWENVTQEERMEGGPLPELTFPGVLAYVRGLLLTEVRPDSLAGPSPRPEVVEDLLEFLAGRLVELEEMARDEAGDEGDRAALEFRMTDGLLDRVLVTYHGIAPEDASTLGPG
jgi:hypothetical protein